jgi:hypothetical protein
MEKLGTAYNLPPQSPRPTRGPTERGELLKEFVDRINASRRGTKYPPYDIPRMAKLLEGISTQWLSYLMKVCKSSRNFSPTFFWRLKEEREAMRRNQ